MLKLLIMFFILVWAIKTVLVTLNVFKLRKSNVPDVFKDIVTEEEYQKSKLYLEEVQSLEVIEDYASLLLKILLVVFGLNFIELWLSSIKFQPWLNSFLVWGSLVLIYTLYELPFSIYRSLKIEKKYGVSTEKLPGILKDTGLSLIIGLTLIFLLTPVINFVLSLQNWWIYMTILSVLLVILQLWVFPLLIAPLFNKFTPYEGELKDSLIELAKKSGFNVEKVFVMDASKRTKKANAYVTGVGNSKRIVLYDTILDYPKEEILAIFAHELGHAKHKHISKRIVQLLVLISLFFYVSNIFLNKADQEFLFNEIATKGIILLIFVNVLTFFTMPILSYLSRKDEYQADEYSAKMLGSPEPLIRSLKRLVKQNLSNLNPHKLYALWFYTHPTPVERILNLERFKN